MTMQHAKEQFSVGTSVRYYPDLLTPGKFQDGEVRSEPWELGGRIVVLITGKTGGVCVAHLRHRHESTLLRLWRRFRSALGKLT